MGDLRRTLKKGRRADRDSKTAGASALLLVVSILLASMPAVAAASTGPYSRIKSICLRERVVLRPERQAQAADDVAEQKIRMVRISFCDLRRPGCFAGEDEVAMTVCTKPE